ncbi:hypothetical protein LOZ58_006686 [Ophidiomyces ophidiicola]|nr:hypothetical protein LOZ58_006686 [Ophidiomyces ophidiicola]
MSKEQEINKNISVSTNSSLSLLLQILQNDNSTVQTIDEESADEILFTPKPTINGQKLLNRIQQLEKTTQVLGQQNLKLKDHNQQLKAQIIATTIITEQINKVKVNPSESFREEQRKLQSFLEQLQIYMNMREKEFNTDKDKVMMAAS